MGDIYVTIKNVTLLSPFVVSPSPILNILSLQNNYLIFLLGG